MSKAKFPQWADPHLSAQLADIRAKGEWAESEFKKDFTEQAHDLAKELAALGTWGGGQLFLGIDDTGELVGLDAPDGAARDKVVERAQGIVDTVRPDLRVDILFAVEEGMTVLAIIVPAQEEPVFYYRHRPYIRDGRHSRPATPDEVKERVWSHPSAEYQRERERIELQLMRVGLDGSQRFSEDMADARLRNSQHNVEVRRRFAR